MESGRITTQRCPFSRFLAALIAHTTALPLDPPEEGGKDNIRMNKQQKILYNRS